MIDRRLAGDAVVALRRYEAHDEDAAIALWLRTWQAAYPDSISPRGLSGGGRAGAMSWCRQPRS